jgi:hypothetical protein
MNRKDSLQFKFGIRFVKFGIDEQSQSSAAELARAYDVAETGYVH